MKVCNCQLCPCSPGRSLYMHNSEANLALDFDYTPLPSFSLHMKNYFPTPQGLSVYLSVCLSVSLFVSFDVVASCSLNVSLQFWRSSFFLSPPSSSRHLSLLLPSLLPPPISPPPSHLSHSCRCVICPCPLCH